MSPHAPNPERLKAALELCLHYHDLDQSQDEIIRRNNKQQLISDFIKLSNAKQKAGDIRISD